MNTSLRKGLLVVLFSFLSSAAMADYVANNGNDSVVLSESQTCTNPEILKQIPAPLQEQFRAAVAHVDGKDYNACWIGRGDAAYLLYEDGDKGVIPADYLKKTKEV